jgi:hypothetical protein
VTGYSNVIVLRVLAELGVAGVALLWIGSLVAARRISERS